MVIMENQTMEDELKPLGPSKGVSRDYIEVVPPIMENPMEKKMEPHGNLT